MRDQSPALPGLEDLVKPVVDRPGATDMTDGKRYTAEVVMRDYPGVAQQVARALFYHRLTIRTVADCFRMSKACVAAIRDRVLAEASVPGAPSFFIKSRTRSQRDIVLAKIMDELDDRMSDPSRLDSMPTKDLMDFAIKLESARPATNGTEPVDVQVVSADEFDQAIDNGLGVEKNPARGLGVAVGESLGSGDGSGVDGVPGDGADDGADDGVDGCGSFEMSYNSPNTSGCDDAWCNDRCKSGSVTAVVATSVPGADGVSGGRPGSSACPGGAPADEPVPAASGEKVPGGAGVGAPTARGGLT